ncbi:MAG: efflux RND transporter periplasmic adaptor subunit [Deltaproteobacteria bacterium]|nr:efflux RND transporter periplasmic adaptor subunit [Deltaproteobacteria bacterium]
MKKAKKKRLKRILVLALVLVGIFWAYWQWGYNPKQKKSPGKRARVIRREFRTTVMATGTVKPQVGAEVRVGARISGKVEHLRANIGDNVKKGQVIAELEKADLEAGVRRRRAEVRVAQARVGDAKARLLLSQLQLQRQERLKKKDFTTQDALDRARSEEASAHAGLILATRQVDASKAALKEAKVKVSYTVLTAPIDGVIASVATQEGETVSAGLKAPTFVTILDLKRLQVDAYVDEVDIGKVQVGQHAIFTVDSLPGREMQGTVTAIYPKAVIQDNVVNYDVVLSILTPYEGLLRPDMTANVTIQIQARKGVLAVPARAVRRIRGRTVVVVRSGGRPVQRPVKVGWKDGRWVEICSGLKEGETILLSTH